MKKVMEAFKLFGVEPDTAKEIINIIGHAPRAYANLGGLVALLTLYVNEERAKILARHIKSLD